MVCTNDEFYDNSNNSCLASCSDPNKVWNKLDDGTQTCYDNCMGDYYLKTVSTRECVKSCDTLKYSLNNETCVDECPKNWYSENGLNFCYDPDGCPADYNFFKNTTKSCVKSCAT